MQQLMIKKIRIIPDVEGINEFEMGKNQVSDILLDDEREAIKIIFKDDETQKESMSVPIEGLIKIEYKKGSEWDIKLISTQGDREVYYKKAEPRDVKELVMFAQK